MQKIYDVTATPTSPWHYCQNCGHRKNIDSLEYCGNLVKYDGCEWNWKVQVFISGKGEDLAMVVYLVSDGINQCCVHFLQKPFTKHPEYDGAMMQVADVCMRDDGNEQRRRKFHNNCGYVEAAIITLIIILSHLQ